MEEEVIVSHGTRQKIVHCITDNSFPYSKLGGEDYEPQSPTSDIPTWKRNVRNILQYRKKTGEIKWNGEAHYLLSGRGNNVMIQINASEAQPRLYDLIEETGLSHKPLIISGKQSNAVLISEEDWESVQETLYLLSIPNMRKSIREGLSTPTEECAKELDW